jgi:hypothetical protein
LERIGGSLINNIYLHFNILRQPLIRERNRDLTFSTVARELDAWQLPMA